MALAFVDANIFIYAAGRPHELKAPCLAVLQLVSEAPTSFVTSSEVLQELMHYYLSKGLRSQGLQVVESCAELMEGRIEAVSGQDVLVAYRAAAASSLRAEARDWLHNTVAARLGVSHIVSADEHFDHLPGPPRLDPRHIASWRSLFTAE